MKSTRLLLFIVLTLLLSSCTPPEVFDGQNTPSDASVTIAYAEPLSSYSPLSYEAKNRKYLTNIYESLVSFDSTFNYETALAVSWGRLDDTTWDFHLREGVYFHDGSGFDADDVLYSFQVAQAQEASELGALLGNIVSIEKTDLYRVEIKTKVPDPLLLNKLTYVYMVPGDYENFDLPVGTGPYRAFQFIDNTLVLERFDDYWGPLAYFKQARLRYIADPKERLDAFLNNEVQVLANVPPQYVPDLESAGISVQHFPSLEVSYLMFNMRSVFADSNLRAAVWLALSTDYADTLGGGYLLSTSQVAAKGITGYQGDFELREQDVQRAGEFRAAYPDEVNVTLDLPSGLNALGEAIAADLAKIDITVTVNILEPEAFEEKILSGASDFYFFGWKYDLADSVDFFESVAHTREGNYGEFNGISYSNSTLDEQIEETSRLLDTAERRTQLETLNELLLNDKVIEPLFESQVLYAVRPELYYKFRLDGLILASEIVENVVK